MRVHLVNCALRGVTHNYAALWAMLERIKARQVMDNAWLLETESSIEQVTALMLAHIGDTDQLFVIEIVPNSRWSATRLLDQGAQWLKERRP